MNVSTITEWVTLAIQVGMFIGVCITISIQIKTQLNVKKIEVATNSMKDALVAATAKASGLEGEARGRAETAAAVPDAPVEVTIVEQKDAIPVAIKK